MKKYSLALIPFVFAMFGCSSAPEKVEAQAATVETETATTAPLMMPFQLELNAESVEDNTLVTIQAKYLRDIDAQTTLTIIPGDGTQLLENKVKYRSMVAPSGNIIKDGNNLVETIDAVKSDAIIQRQIMLSGANPSVEVKIGLYEEGLSIEMHESWPKVDPVVPEDPMKPLDNPVEINGLTIENSVEVMPKRRGTSK